MEKQGSEFMPVFLRRHRRAWWLVLLALVSQSLFAEPPTDEYTNPTERQLLRPKQRRAPEPKTTPTAPLLGPKLRPETKEKEATLPSLPTGLSLLAFTPLVKENFYDARFSSLGAMVLVAFPIASLSNEVRVIRAETGLGFNISRLSLNQPVVDFTHWYYQVPIRMRLQFQLPHFTPEIFAGVHWRVFEYDSRNNADGGFHSTSPLTQHIDPEFGVGATYALADEWLIRGSISYLALAIGAEYLF